MGTEINPPNSTKTSPSKRVLFIVTQSEIGGAQEFLHTLVNHLEKTKYGVLVAGGASSTNDKQKIKNYELLNTLEKEGFNVKRLEYLQRELSPILDIKALFEIRKLIKEFQSNTLFLLSSKAGFLSSLATALLHYRPNRPRVIYRIGGWSFNDPWPKWKRWLWIILEKISARWKDYIIVNNKHDLEQAYGLKIKPREKVVLVYNGIDVYKTEFLPKEEARLKLFEKIAKNSGKIFQADTIIGTIANFYPTKGLSFLIETAEYFKNNDSVVFIIVGDGTERPTLKKLIEEKGLRHKVILAGQIPEAKKYLPAFDIFVLPSLKEGFPWVLIEAMAAKLPVIAAKVGAVEEIIENGKNGFTVEPAKPNQIAEKIKTIIADEHLKQELGIQAHQTVLFKFPLEKMIKEVESVL